MQLISTPVVTDPCGTLRLQALTAHQLLHMICLPHRPPNIPHPNQLIQTPHEERKHLLLTQSSLVLPLLSTPDLRKSPEPIVDIYQTSRRIEVELM